MSRKRKRKKWDPGKNPAHKPRVRPRERPFEKIAATEKQLKEARAQGQRNSSDGKGAASNPPVVAARSDGYRSYHRDVSALSDPYSSDRQVVDYMRVRSVRSPVGDLFGGPKKARRNWVPLGLVIVFVMAMLALTVVIVVWRLGVRSD